MLSPSHMISLPSWKIKLIFPQTSPHLCYQIRGLTSMQRKLNQHEKNFLSFCKQSGECCVTVPGIFRVFGRRRNYSSCRYTVQYPVSIILGGFDLTVRIPRLYYTTFLESWSCAENVGNFSKLTKFSEPFVKYTKFKNSLSFNLKKCISFKSTCTRQ